MWIGCSVMTVVEILELITDLLTYMWGKHKEKEKLTAIDAPSRPGEIEIVVTPLYKIKCQNVQHGCSYWRH